jgi:hypothetical protein
MRPAEQGGRAWDPSEPMLGLDVIWSEAPVVPAGDRLG